MSIRIATSSVNQTPLDWENNFRNIEKSIKASIKNQIEIICFPELTITGYGCQDLFLNDWFIKKSNELLNKIVNLSKSITVIVGHPLQFQNKIYNSCCIIKNAKILGFFIKSNLPNDGLHSEKRWFSSWKFGKKDQINFKGKNYPIGTIQVEYSKSLTLGFEICRDAWDIERPANYIATKKNLIIFNPIASHYAFKKFEFRKNLIINSSKKFNCTYISVNLLGNESGKVIFEGDTIIASKGSLISVTKRFSLEKYSLSFFNIDPEKKYSKLSIKPINIYEEFIDAFSLALLDYVSKSKLSGFALSLSGGLDSTCIAILIYMMVNKVISQKGIKEINKRFNLNLTSSGDVNNDTRLVVNNILYTAYQKSKNSSSKTKISAKNIADFIKSNHYEWSIDSEVDSIIKKISHSTSKKYTWKNHNLSLQNIQARVRSPFIWFIANTNNLLLLSTSNRSESSVGYCTMDGDTSGSLSPIAGIDKVFIKDFLTYLMDQYNYTPLKKVLDLKPSAELKPKSLNQIDENELMPYKILSRIERLAIKERKSPQMVLHYLRKEKISNDKSLKKYIRAFYTLLSKNQWKRERFAPSFHFDDYSLEASSWFRFPILSKNYKEELKKLI